MKTIILEANLPHIAITVPDEFVTKLVAESQLDNAPPFLKAMHDQHKDDDEAFLQAVLANGVRNLIQNSIRSECAVSGFGLRLAPPSIARTPEDAARHQARESTRTQSIPATELNAVA